MVVDGKVSIDRRLSALVFSCACSDSKKTRSTRSTGIVSSFHRATAAVSTIERSERCSRRKSWSLSVARAVASFTASTYGSHFVLCPFCRCTWWPVLAPSASTLSLSSPAPFYPAETHHHDPRSSCSRFSFSSFLCPSPLSVRRITQQLNACRRTAEEVTCWFR